MGTEYDPFGREYRTGRLSDEETAERMLATATDKVNRDGLQVSFDLLRIEDLIAEAGVARSAVYRRWPTKQHFYADLLRRLATQPHPTITAGPENTLSLAILMVRKNADKLRTQAGRHSLTVELLRLSVIQNYELVTNSSEWSVHLTLMATLIGLPEDRGTLRPDLEGALAESEQVFVRTMSAFYQGILPVVGYRLRPDIEGLTMETAIAMGAAMVEGSALNPFVSALVPHKTFVADPFGTGESAEWSLPSLGYASVWFTLAEPDPERAGDWSDEQVEAVLQGLADIVTSAQEASE